jgi:hypothetical protein
VLKDLVGVALGAREFVIVDECLGDLQAPRPGLRQGVILGLPVDGGGFDHSEIVFQGLGEEADRGAARAPQSREVARAWKGRGVVETRQGRQVDGRDDGVLEYYVLVGLRRGRHGERKTHQHEKQDREETPSFHGSSFSRDARYF